MKKLLLLLLVAIGACAQSPSNPTIILFPFTARTTTGASLPLSRASTVAYHQLFVSLTASGGACIPQPTTFDVGLEVSTNNVLWENLGNSISAPGTTSGSDIFGTVTMFGLFPYVRVNIRALTTNCALSATYTGSLYPTPNNINIQDNSSTLIQGPIGAGGVGTVTTIIPAVTGKTPVVYGLFLSAAGINTIFIDAMNGWTVGTASTIIIPNTGIPQLVGTTGSAMTLTTSAAPAVNGYVTYRYR